MRREHGSTKKVEIPEKKKREAIMRSIATEETVITEKKKERDVLQKEIADLQVIAGTIAIENDVADTELSSKKDQIFTLKSEIEAKTREVEALERKATFLEQKLELTESEIQRVKANHVKDHSDILYRIQKAKEQETLTVANINGEINFLKEKIAALAITESGLILAIDKMTREKTNLEHAIASRISGLAHINKNLAESSFQRERAEKQLREVDEKLASVRETLAEQDRLMEDKNKEIEEKEEQIEERRQTMVGLVVREKNLAMKTEAMRSLFQQAGLKVDF